MRACHIESTSFIITETFKNEVIEKIYFIQTIT